MLLICNSNLGVNHADKEKINTQINVPKLISKVCSLLNEKPFCSMTINSLSDLNLPMLKTILIKKLSGKMIWQNSGSLKSIIQNTTSGFISPLAA
jgi:hypothetical protein